MPDSETRRRRERLPVVVQLLTSNTRIPNPEFALAIILSFLCLHDVVIRRSYFPSVESRGACDVEVK